MFLVCFLQNVMEFVNIFAEKYRINVTTNDLKYHLVCLYEARTHRFRYNFFFSFFTDFPLVQKPGYDDVNKSAILAS